MTQNPSGRQKCVPVARKPKSIRAVAFFRRQNIEREPGAMLHLPDVYLPVANREIVTRDARALFELNRVWNELSVAACARIPTLESKPVDPKL